MYAASARRGQRDREPHDEPSGFTPDRPQPRGSRCADQLQQRTYQGKDRSLPTLLRPVGGGVNDTVKAVAKEAGLPIINWSVDTEDWKYRDAEHVKQVIVEQAGDGDVVLMHDLYPTSVKGALDAIDELQKRTDKTYAFVTVSQLAAIHGITLEPGVVYNGLSDKVAQEIKDGTYSPAEFT